MRWGITTIKQAESFQSSRISKGSGVNVHGRFGGRKLGIEPHTDEVRRKMGIPGFEYLGEITASPVIFGEEGDAALMGATTLEGFGYVLDPFRRELRPMSIRL